MTSSTFTTNIDMPPPDPAKHVNFTQGMVLGMEDFTQEFAYLSGRDQSLARDTIGYGTVCGLHVALDSADFKKVSVSPGIALNPRGQIIRVKVRQCAQLDAWLALQTTVDRMSELGIGTIGDFTAYVVLCYRDCPTDEVPVPGEPCRCDTDTMAPSRIMDDFRLELTLTPPPQLEEDAVRDLIDWMRQIEVADFEPTRADLDSFLQAIRDAMGAIISPPESPPPDYFYGSPPASLRLPRGALCQWMRAAMRLWVTELRPLWRAQCAPLATGSSDPCGCHGIGTEPEGMACECILLAAITITRGSSGITGGVIDEEHRPFLVHLRMLQELLLCGPCCGSSCGNNRTFATVYPVDSITLRIWVHYPVTLDLPAEAVSLALDDAAVTDFTITASGGNFFDLELTGSPPPILSATTAIELEFDASLIQQTDGRDLTTAIREDGYCYPDYTEPRLQVFAASGLESDLAGDVVGPPTQNQLEAIHGDPLDLDGLSDGQVLRYDNGEWHPVSLPQPASTLGGDVEGAIEITRVVALQNVAVSGTSLGTDQDGFVLTYRSNSNEWIPEQPTTTSAFKVTSGLVIFQETNPQDVRVSPLISHDFDKKLVMIRLGLEEDQGTIRTEDVDSVAATPIDLDMITPHMMARYERLSSEFQVIILDERKEGGPHEWRIRWWAIQATKSLPDTIIKPGENFIPEELVARSIPEGGITRKNLATRLGTTETGIQPILDRLVASGTIRVTRNRIKLIQP